MKARIDLLFGKKSIVVILITLLIAALLLVWDYTCLSYLSGSTDWFAVDIATGQEAAGLFAMLGVGALVTTIFAFLVLCNVKFWLLPCLLKALICLIGAIPIVNLIVSKELRESWADAINSAFSMESHWVFDPFSLFLFRLEEDEQDGIIDLLIHFVISTVFAMIVNIIGFILYIIAAVGIPVVCPIATVLAMGGIIALTENPIWLTVIGVICFLIVGFVFIGIPIIAFCKKNKSGK